MMSNWQEFIKQREKEEEAAKVLMKICIVALIILVLFAAYAGSLKSTHCNEMEELNPDWEFHYDRVTGCRVLFHDFWVPVDDMPDVLLGGE